MFDLVIRQGSVIDGSAGPRRTADVAVQGGRIAEGMAAGICLFDADRVFDRATFDDPAQPKALAGKLLPRPT